MFSQSFNKFSALPFIPYKIITHLAQDPKVEGLWKLLYYDTYDALSKPNLSYEDKIKLIWCDGQNQNNVNVFLTFQVENMQTESRTFIKIYKVDSDPIDPYKSTVCYEFDILFGGKIAMVEYDGIPCNRGDVIEMLLLQSLNGIDVQGVGFLQYNGQLSRLCRSRLNIGNNTNYTGVSVIMATQVANLYDTEC